MINRENQRLNEMETQSSTSGEAYLAQQNQIFCQENHKRTQNEQALYNAYINEKTARRNLENALTNMQKQLDALQLLIKNQNTYNPTSIPVVNQCTENKLPVNYETDEEELQKEVGWITVKRNKKRKANYTPEASPQQPKTIKAQELNKEIKVPRPPPIIVSNVTDFDLLYETMKTNNILFRATTLNNEQIKLNAECRKTFTKIAECLEFLKLQWHSYEDKQTRDIKVMARGLPPTAKTTKIVEELIKNGLKCTDVTNILKKERNKNNNGEIVVQKKPLPLFMLSFQHNTDIKAIYEIKQILGVEVKIEPLRKANLVPQCKRCQLHGHTQKFCKREPRCVKCSGKHITGECKKPKGTKAKCANCNEAHPASYRGCVVAKTFQERRNKISQAKEQKTVTQNKQPKMYNEVNDEMTYAQSINQTAQKETKKEDVTTNELLLKLIAKLDNQEKIIESFSERLLKLENNRAVMVFKSS
ncbi:uncharacterized protein LOC143199341 [Rhynchophorus ferrugineus]|uniref:uncharacterized protein LOC143199341 n=1 Tax=Rhynchophorus ferrugineus TaxID=354439 RepID=UPI003FCD1640